MKALVADGTDGAAVAEVEDLPVRDTFVRIKVHALALNPTDYKHVFGFAKGGEIVGCDVAGIVEAIGQQVKSKVKVGDRIAGLVHGCNSYAPRDGGFAEYAEIKDGIFAHLPDDWSWSSGATLGAGVTTAGQGLFQSLQLPLPDEPTPKSFAVLIYGGSTATGCLAIQYARLAGLQVITLASPHQFDRLKSLGASVCYDYHEGNVGSRIRRETNNGLMYAFDIITNESSMKICADALAGEVTGSKRPRCSLLLPGKVFPSGIGETSMKYGKVVEGQPKDYEFAKMFWSLTSHLINEGKLKAHVVEERQEGLEGVLSGLRDLKDGKVKGHKLVYTL
ncbi:GroES-like protein [Colletotrichum karsti]|uniref:GroES-like protein n=1 Tax=Colletotrichum karsti TaxID=1095194 RepID=A0A9P6HZ90_9PEZI|nr:GroES-like protein [Colletotrichum karsti]KAF9872885.1 GroES-like protein [Colletotrichum karsti]